MRAEPGSPRSPLGRPRCPEPVPRLRGGSASRAPRTHRCWAAGTAWRPRGLPMSSGRRASSGDHAALSVLDHGSARRQSSKRSFPSRCGAARRVLTFLPFAGLPVRPAAAGAADPAQRMPVIPLCRLAGVEGHGEERGGVGDGGRWNEGGEEVGRRGSGWSGRACGVCEPCNPQPHPPIAESSGDSPLNLKGSLANDPLGLEEKELEYLVTVLNLRKFVSRKLVPSSLLLCVRFFFSRFKNLPFNK